MANETSVEHQGGGKSVMHYAEDGLPLVQEVTLPKSTLLELETKFRNILGRKNLKEYIDALEARVKDETSRRDSAEDAKRGRALVYEHFYRRVYDAFNDVMHKSEAGNSALEALHQVMLGEENKAQAAHIVGLPEDRDYCIMALIAIQKHMGQRSMPDAMLKGNIAEGLAADLHIPDRTGGAVKKNDTDANSVYHQDGTYSGLASAVVLYGGKRMAGSQTPTVVSRVDPILYRAANREAAIREELFSPEFLAHFQIRRAENSYTDEALAKIIAKDEAKLRALLPAPDATIEEKVEWIRGIYKELHNITDRTAMNGAPYIDIAIGDPDLRKAPPELVMKCRYLNSLMERVRSDSKDIGVPVHVKPGGVLAVNNRTTLHCRGDRERVEGEKPETRGYRRVYIYPDESREGQFLTEDMLKELDERTKALVAKRG